MPELITVKLKPLTPLWTGDANQDPAKRGSRVREMGILGSLRWWYEAIIRGLGLYACDPSSGACVYDEKTGLSSICHTCQLFGCTGYGRRFRLVVKGGGDAGQPTEVKLRDPGTNNHRGWRIPPKVAGPITLAFLPLSPNGLDRFDKAAICHTLCLIERYGALGAKTSHGQGVIKIMDWDGLPVDIGSDDWIKIKKERLAKTGANPQRSPNLGEFLGVTIALESNVTSGADWWKMIPLNGLDRFSLGSNPMWVPSAPVVRARLRSWLRSDANFPSFTGILRNERHRLMGTTDKSGGPKGSEIFVTHFYKDGGQWQMRIFAFVPSNGNAVDRAVRDFLKNEEDKMKGEVQSALGNITVDICPYPASVSSLLANNARGQL